MSRNCLMVGLISLLLCGCGSTTSSGGIAKGEQVDSNTFFNELANSAANNQNILGNLTGSKTLTVKTTAKLITDSSLPFNSSTETLTVDLRVDFDPNSQVLIYDETTEGKIKGYSTGYYHEKYQLQADGDALLKIDLIDGKQYLIPGVTFTSYCNNLLTNYLVPKNDAKGVIDVFLNDIEKVNYLPRDYYVGENTYTIEGDYLEETEEEFHDSPAIQYLTESMKFKYSSNLTEDKESASLSFEYVESDVRKNGSKTLYKLAYKTTATSTVKLTNSK